MNRIENHLITFCGVFSFTKDDLVSKYSSERYSDYFSPENKEFDLYRSQYYSNYTNIIISRKCYDPQITVDGLEHKTIKDIEHLKKITLKTKKNNIKFSISNVDLFFFPELIKINTEERLGIYSFSTKIEAEEITPELVTDFIANLRFIHTDKISIGTESYTTLNLVEKFIIDQKISNKYISDIIGSKLKVFSVINYKNYPNDQLDELLYDIGTTSEIGSASGKGYLAPSRDYYKHLIDNNTISCFANWKALALFDSFTVVGSELRIETWQKNYFFIYIASLKQKFYMFRINSELSDITQIKRSSAKLRDTFIEFINDNMLSQISFNFLPNIIYSKMQYALEVKQEVEELELKINRITMLVQEKQQSRLNSLIFLITIIGITSAMWDTSEYLRSILGFHDNLFYPIWGISVFVMISFLVIVFFYFLKRK